MIMLESDTLFRIFVQKSTAASAAALSFLLMFFFARFQRPKTHFFQLLTELFNYFVGRQFAEYGLSLFFGCGFFRPAPIRRGALLRRFARLRLSSCKARVRRRRVRCRKMRRLSGCILLLLGFVLQRLLPRPFCILPAFRRRACGIQSGRLLQRDGDIFCFCLIRCFFNQIDLFRCDFDRLI